MLTVAKNHYFTNLKESSIFTPPGVAKFIFDIISPQLDCRSGIVVDPACGAGALLQPWQDAGIDTQGIDIFDHGWPDVLQADFLAFNPGELPRPHLVVANPPFNVTEATKENAFRFFGGRPLLPEVFLFQCVNLWDSELPMVFIVPHGLRLNTAMNSRRRKYFLAGTYPEICSIITLPKDVFDGIVFHCEILIFNVPGLKPHYFYEPPADSPLLSPKS